MMDKSPIQHLIDWLVDESVITNDQADRILGPLSLTIKNHYVLKDHHELCVKNLKRLNESMIKNSQSQHELVNVLGNKLFSGGKQ